MPKGLEETETEWWDWYQRNIVYMGEPFKFQIGPFAYYVPCMTKKQYIELNNAIIDNIESHDYFAKVVIPANNFSKLLEKYMGFLFFIVNHVPMMILSGIISEYLLYITAIKKKMLVIQGNGIALRDHKEQLTTLQKTQLLESNIILRKTGLEVYGIT